MIYAIEGEDYLTLFGGEDFTVYQLVTECGYQYIASEYIEPCTIANWNKDDEDSVSIAFCTHASKHLLRIANDGTRTSFDSEGNEIDYGSFVYNISKESSVYDCIIESCIYDAISNHSL